MTVFMESSMTALQHAHLGTKRENRWICILPGITALLFVLPLIFPDFALASGGIAAFSSPLEKVVKTITGPAGRYISIVAMALCGMVFVMNKDDISGGFKLLLSVVFGISFIAFSATIVNSVFNFQGAVI
jgi:type IV secretion system protein VirB2